MNDIEGWGEDGVAAYELVTTKANVDGQEQLPRYYVEELASPNIIKYT